MARPSSLPCISPLGRFVRRWQRDAGASNASASIASSHRRAAALFGAAALTLLLTGCPSHPPPTDVPYPHDPRVLDGSWQVTVTGLMSGATDLVYAPVAGRLVVWFDESTRTFQRDDAHTWSEVAVAWGGPVAPGWYDPALEAFVAVEFASVAPRIRVTPIDGGRTTVAEVTLPAGHTLVSATRGSGRSFALTRDGSGGYHLTWWDSTTGALEGIRAVGAPRDGMRTSSNGRVVALWNLDTYRVDLVDSAAPHVVRTLRLGACRSNGVSEASADGRWFLFADCLGNLRIADLAATNPGSSALGVGRQGRVTFALDGAEVIWIDDDGIVRAIDPHSGARVVLARLEGDESLDAYRPWGRAVIVHRQTDLQAVITGRGTVRATSLSGATTNEPAELPTIGLTGADLDLTVEPIDADGATSYEFSGTFTASGTATTGETLPITGSVFSYGLHRYVPAPPDVVTAALPPPSLHAMATVTDIGSTLPAFGLTFSTTDRAATRFDGDLYDHGWDTSYRVRVERAGVSAP